MRYKFGHNIPLILVSVLFLIISGINERTAGRGAIEKDEKFKRAVELYNRGLFESAEKGFNDLLTEIKEGNALYISEVEAYLTLISIRCEKPDLYSRYALIQEKWPDTHHMAGIKLYYGYHLFNNDRYTEAYDVLSQIKRSDLTRTQINEYNFKWGYTNFRIGNSDLAIELFSRLIDGSPNAFTNPAIYYTAHIHYMSKNFEKAVDMFQKIGEDPRFSLLSKYYILESKFMLKEYRYVTENGPGLYELLLGELKSKCARVISEAFFALDNIEMAEFYFSRYSYDKSDLSQKDIYYAGILAYTQKRYIEAIDILKQVIDSEESIAQNAAYHMGRCYIEIKNKFEALNSFRLASELSYDRIIKEDAMFNYAKLAFDLNSDISIFRRYLDIFSPPEEKYNEIQNYIATSYLLKQDYKSAIDILKTIRNPSSKDIINLQKATFLRGMQLVNLGAYRDAIPLFELSLTNGTYNNNLFNVTQFWLAEAYYRNNQFQRSVEKNLALLRNSNFKGNREYSTAHYNLGYSYFKLNNYPEAEKWFARYLNLPMGEILYLDEARVRLGDCFFMQRKYQEAIDYYSLITSSSKSLSNHAVYNTSIALGLLGNDSKKAEVLKSLLSKELSKNLYPEVLYELGRTLIQIGENSEAEKYFKELSESYQNSTYFPKALLELGLISLNRGQGNSAIEYYKKILSVNPDSPEAQNAIAGLENIYKEQGRAQEFLDYLDRLGMSQTKSASDKEMILFSSAEKQFLSGNYLGAITSISSFLKSFPNGVKSAQAWFYLGESYLKISKPEMARDAFMEVMKIEDESFNELATLNYAKISYSLQNYTEAGNAYSTLLKIAKLENNRVEAQIGLINSYFLNAQYHNAIAEGEKVLELREPGIDAARIQYIIGKSYFLTGQRDKALTYLKETAKDKMRAEGAESAYLIISNYFDKGDFNKVEKEVYAFADSNTPESYWLAKSFILLGDSFAERENWEQAEATFTSIIESYKPKTKDDIEEQVKMRLSKIQEGKSNDKK